MIDIAISDVKTNEENADKFEYGNPKTTHFPELKGNSKIGIPIPQSIILDKDCDLMRLAAYSYLYVRRGQDNIMYFSVNTMLDWMHKKKNRHKGGINDKAVELLEHFKDQKYIMYDNSVFDKEKLDDGKLKKVNIWEQFFGVRFMMDTLHNQIDDGAYTFLYWDEILTIMRFKNTNKKDVYVNNTTILLVLAYLRWRIGKRPNRINERNRSQDWIEAWNCYYKSIADELGISVKMVSECVNILKKLGLIYYERISTTKISESDYRSRHAIFVNTYKREGNVLLTSGRDYYMNELQKKKKLLKC